MDISKQSFIVVHLMVKVLDLLENDIDLCLPEIAAPQAFDDTFI